MISSDRGVGPISKPHTSPAQIGHLRKRNEEAEFGVAGGHGAFPHVSGPGMKLSDRGGRPSEAGADGGMGRSTIAGAFAVTAAPALEEMGA